MREPARASIWLAAAGIAALATWVCYDAAPGINWPLWTAAAAAGFVWFSRHRPDSLPLVGGIGAAAVVLAGGVAITTNPFSIFIIFLAVILLLSVAMLLSAAPIVSRITTWFTILAPLLAITGIIVSAVARAGEATRLVRSTRARAVLRGIAITLPVLVIFALLLSSADPTFALWRNTIEDILTSWAFLPRTIFFVLFLILALGALSYAALAVDSRAVTSSQPRQWLGSAERLILISSVAALLWLFLAIQLSYLFGNLPEVPGSGITFAEYARRGFGELTIVALATALLIALTERYVVVDQRQRVTRIVTFVLIAAVLLLLGSAFNRVLLYEEAYGFTTARLYAKAAMILIATGLVAMSVEVAGEFDAGRLFRRVGAATLVVLTMIVYWNHEAWIARRNIERFAATGKLDAGYLVRDLSPDAIPAIISLMPGLPDPARAEMRHLLERRYTARHPLLADRRWFEANVRRSQAREALAALGRP